MENPNPTQENNNNNTGGEQPTQEQPGAAGDTNAGAEKEQIIQEKDAEIARLKEEKQTIEQSKAALETSLAETNQKLTATETELANFRREVLVKEIAIEVGLPAAVASRLKGATEEELRNDAKELAGLLGKAPAATTPPTPTPGANPPTPGAGGASGQPNKQSGASDNLEPRPANIRF